MSDLIDRQLAHDVVDAEIINANPEHFKASEKFIKFMNDEEVSSFGKWQWANGFNTAIVAALIQIKRVPSAQPKTGKWIKLDAHAHLADHKCSACGQECYVPTCMGDPMYDFCPHCGARMLKEGEQND